MSKFDYFVVFAEMRTGSNFLETNINAFDALSCHGEAFNPHFIGYPNRDDVLGVTLEQRTADPVALLRAIKEEPGVLSGFRYFHDHDPRVLDTCLNDPRCAKIVLTRNPLDSYVSWKIAQATGQWKLTDVRRRKDSKVRFDGPEFKRHVEDLQDFQVTLMKALQTSGQTAFYVAYEDLQDIDVMNGLARYLGVDETLPALDKSLKRQNPSAVSEKVSNFAEVSLALADLDRFNLNRTPNFEPRRGSVVPTYLAGAVVPLMYMPVRSGPEEQVAAWLAALDSVTTNGLMTDFSQKTLRKWKRSNKGHRTFTVVRHPVARVHAAFCSRILRTDEGSYSKIRNTLRRVHKLPLPKEGPGPDYDVAAHRAAFLAFLDFVKANLQGQTGIRQDAHWATQSGAMRGFGDFALPDMIVREEEMGSYLPALAMQVGRKSVPDLLPAKPDTPIALEAIYDEEIESRVRDIYQRDYMVFGFEKWR
ncbi:Sulfotransferase family protein [Shimia sp. SK013]|uniref:sulfotransferase family 2 domain-containing protein n=1 Tax=Shimia sp. SK013 TaxID=1389006 RepID=UPI0006B42CEB|nr:sulfotransferase family 2 domain-containing protein [Shimia sp. SK013]KPA23446.1 Sulfotransferase family protein [Shimia sp. SK013]